MKTFYQLSKEEVINELQTSPSGLKSEMVPALREKFGENVLQEAKQKANYLFFLDSSMM
jgi:Ca2+-transporting ATPase